MLGVLNLVKIQFKSPGLLRYACDQTNNVKIHANQVFYSSFHRFSHEFAFAGFPKVKRF
jgi:hypothetical protein